MAHRAASRSAQAADRGGEGAAHGRSRERKRERGRLPRETPALEALLRVARVRSYCAGGCGAGGVLRRLRHFLDGVYGHELHDLVLPLLVRGHRPAAVRHCGGAVACAYETAGGRRGSSHAGGFRDESGATGARRLTRPANVPIQQFRETVNRVADQSGGQSPLVVSTDIGYMGVTSVMCPDIPQTYMDWQKGNWDRAYMAYSPRLSAR